MLAGRAVVLGVSGGVAAYKAVEVCRRLMDAGAVVRPVLTSDAQHFVGAHTFSALASEPTRTSLWDSPEPSPHTFLGQGADLIVVAPATARVLAAYALGLSDDLLVATLLASRAPVVVCPAMHTEMWEQPAVQRNVELLRQRGVHVVEPGVGHLAGGDVGPGRLAEPVDIVAACEHVLGGALRSDLAGLRVLVTAGGTREPIDAVRVITNRSSGKQGHALAEEAHSRGAAVTLVTSVERPVSPGIEVVRAETVEDMRAAVMPRAPHTDVIIQSAAMSDFRPKAPSNRKIKKEEGPPELLLEPTHDFSIDLGRAKHDGQTLVGFAAETDDLLANARRKLERKGLDLIVANDVSAPGVGFDHDTNAAVILGADGVHQDVPLSDKRVVARAVLDAVLRTRNRSTT
ncbi:MAG: bifunctional phosphopantothenoylcysteine decarboxylase/phosphopantothenate--cysteine ligase CoaBC [Actinomycetota bacterium]|nr:bifunctional phosphopantothenoylcysteine decarboxylase/phosphopantothenate--cysteine ligase CoaBC [Actinomycetota bacterium]